MNALDSIEQFCLWLLDPALGRLSRWPSDVRFVLVALLVSVLLALGRRFVTNQDLLWRAVQDRRRLRALSKLACSQGNRADVQRYRKTRSMIAVRIWKMQVLPLLVLAAPVSAMAIWCQARLAYHPLLVDQPVCVHVYAPVSAIGDLIHIAPQNDISVDRAIRRIELEPSENGAIRRGIASWIIRTQRTGEYNLLFRHQRVSLEQDISVGTNRYQRPVVQGPQEGWATHVELAPVKLFGVIGGIDHLGIPSWLVACLILIVPLYYAGKRLLRIY
ncbi:MAG: hypothetical protein JW828_12210 [Sedimentisphaerales bacterium]|nr:hypothetical protein [Sedimentisphaerales bacterium]